MTEISFPTDGGKFHDKFLTMGKTLEEMMLADLVEEERDFGYISYHLLTDVIRNRISIDEVEVTENGIKLMNGLVWDFNETPHMLVAGGTGGGKSYFLYSLIKAFMTVGTVDVCDPKNADLADLATIPAFKGHVHYGKTPEPIKRCLENGVKLMEERYRYMKSLPNYVSGKNYAYYDMPPHFIVVDEWVAFFSALDYQAQAEIMKPIQQIVLKARQAGIFLILAMQRPDSQYLGGGIRDNLMFRVTVGKLAPIGYHMVFGDENKNKPFFNKKIKGRGYVDDGSSVPREFYSPLVPKHYKFLEEFGKIDKMIEMDFSEAA
ncbi:FtsK/SpoIIIE domain-containing protein [Enterococcus sp. LJL128]